MNRNRWLVGLALSLGGLGACSSNPTAGECTANDTCESGSICTDGQCRHLCINDLDCDAGEVCDQFCGPGQRSVPVIASVDGDGPESPTGLGHTAHRLDHRLIISGNNLRGAAVSLVQGSTSYLGTVCEETNERLVVELPADVPAGTAVLTVANQAGACQATLPILQGLPGSTGASGPAGPSGPMPVISGGAGLFGDGSPENPVGVAFAGSGSATSVARSDHQHPEIEALTSGGAGLPYGGAHVVTLNNTATDLGTQLNGLLAQYRTVEVTLARDLIFTWNQLVSVGSFQRLAVTGAGYTNGATNIGVIIDMTTGRTFSNGGTDYREVSRVHVGRHGAFELSGVEIRETINDARPDLTPSAGRALFEIHGDFGTLDITQIRITAASENVTNIHGWNYGRIRFGHTFVSKGGSSPRDIYLATAQSGWNYSGHGGIVSASHTTLGTGVTIDTTTRLLVLP